MQLDQIGELEVVNTTTGEPAIHSRIGADGSWDAVVPLVPGPNALAIRAFSETGEEVLRELRVDYRPEAASPALPADLEARRTAARAEELAILASQVDALERRAVARKRAQLLAEISRSRARGAQRRRDPAPRARPRARGARRRCRTSLKPRARR